jgi:hypothetical protein
MDVPSPASWIVAGAILGLNAATPEVVARLAVINRQHFLAGLIERRACHDANHFIGNKLQ